jgi:hypothetical protein
MGTLKFDLKNFSITEGENRPNKIEANLIVYDDCTDIRFVIEDEEGNGKEYDFTLSKEKAMALAYFMIAFVESD